jgi:hypothetical protein
MIPAENAKEVAVLVATGFDLEKKNKKKKKKK